MVDFKCKACGIAIKSLPYKIGSKDIAVSSDAKLHPFAINIYICEHCRHIQKIYASDEKRLIENIYGNYAPHNISNGREQVLFINGQTTKPRTQYVFDKCLPYLPKSGKLLDVGSGNGAVLRSASSVLQGWRLHAYDISMHHKDEIESINGVERFWSGSLPDEKFDLIVSWHSLEHIEDIGVFLNTIRNCLNNDGMFLIQTPDVSRNPFDMAVIDHCSHFTPCTLESILMKYGFEIVVCGNSWIHNCLTYLCKKTVEKSMTFDHVYENPQKLIDWLNSTINIFLTKSESKAYYIFGTGMASVWIAGQMNKLPVGFLDEDEHRWNGNISGVVIFPVSVLKNGDYIFMPFFNGKNLDIADKLSSIIQKKVNFIYLNQ